MLLGAGLAGAVASLAGARGAAATAPPGEGGFTAEDREIITAAIGFELAARDLYDVAIEAGTEPEILEQLSEQHEAFAHVLAGAIGVSAAGVDEAAVERFRGDFSGSSDAALQAAYDLESALVVTHTESLNDLSNLDALKLVAAMTASEARHCVVVADLAGKGDDLDALFTNDATPLVPQETQ